MSEHPYLPVLTLNRAFMAEFISAPPPCFALGLMEASGQECGFLAMRPDKSIPPEITAKGFNFGHGLIGIEGHAVIQFGFEFYGFGTYYVLINPNNPIVQKVLTKMIKDGNYFFMAINPDQSVSTFKATISQGDLAGLKTNFPKIKSADTTNGQYQKTLDIFSKTLEPSTAILNWACRDNMDYLDLSTDRFELNPV